MIEVTVEVHLQVVQVVLVNDIYIIQKIYINIFIFTKNNQELFLFLGFRDFLEQDQIRHYIL